ncbi:DAO domain containing protein [Trichuris trichiura]|uniref:DAO domain containing protein n=1 Tax=Trichuris trichiura TaxID=36087 RepID=A0A077Z5E8_TRITR|nr:DAO domain containing protein [Trichuris trichiura]
MRSYQAANSGMLSFGGANLRDLPDHVDVLIIGGGLSGLSVAYFLGTTSNARVLLLERGRACGIEAKMVSAGEVACRYEGYEFANLKAALLVNDFKVNQFTAVQSFAGAASRAGVSIFENCPVKSLKIVNDHNIEGVETNFGFVKCDILVDAAGAVIAWSCPAHRITLSSDLF